MSAVAAGLGAAAGAGVLGAVAAVVVPRGVRPAVVGACTAGVGVAAFVAGLVAVGGGRPWTVRLPDLLPLAGVELSVDALSGLFLAVSGAVIAAAAVYGISYTRHGLDGRCLQALLPVFAFSLLLVPAAGGAGTFLLAWELMALSSLLLVLAEHRTRPSVREAGVWYAVMTHLGWAVILLALTTFAAHAGGDSFAALRAAGHAPGVLSPATRGLVMVLALIGFGSKAGMVPLHVWLPRAHAEAPSNVSALMSAAMVNMGVYGLVRVVFDLLGGGPRWFGLLVLVLGAVSAVYGILQAALATDLKRLLAYSTSENMGLVLVGLGASVMSAAAGNRLLAGLALAAALLHVVNHAAFKALLFLGAGSVLRATGTRDLDALGGLRARMPATTALFAVGALAAAALPPGNGFVSEWLLLQSLLHGLAVPGVATVVTMPLAAAAVALSAGLAVATFVKALGVGFLARPRTAAAEQAREAPGGMLAGMGLLAAACIALALVPQVVGGDLSRAASSSGLAGGGLEGGQPLRLDGLAGTVAPLWLALALVAAVVLVYDGVRVLAARRRRRAALWDCGAGPPTARMEYTATSFAEPLQRVFDDVLTPEQDVDVAPYAESAYLVERVRYQRRVPDRIERRLYAPVLATAGAVGAWARRLGNGSVHRYLGYGFSGLVGLLVALVVTR